MMFSRKKTEQIRFTAETQRTQRWIHFSFPLRERKAEKDSR